MDYHFQKSFSINNLKMTMFKPESYIDLVKDEVETKFGQKLEYNRGNAIIDNNNIILRLHYKTTNPNNDVEINLKICKN